MAKTISKQDTDLKNKRVIFVLFSFELGGAERQALHLARYLKDLCGAQVEIWAFCNSGRLIEICNKYGIFWKLVPLNLNFDTFSNIINSIKVGIHLRKARPDILLPYLTPANVFCGLIWRLTGAKICIWNQRSGGIERINPFFERLAARNVSGFIANSQQGADFLASSYGVKRENIHIVHNGVDLGMPESDKQTWRKKLKLEGNEFVVCMIANFHAGKDHSTLLKAWKIVEKKIDQPSKLLLAGRFDDSYKIIKKMVAKCGLDQHVIFLGQVNDIAGLLGIVNLGILLSPYENWEGNPNAILEYMLAGLPVVGTDVPGIRETLGDENNDCLAPIGDTEKVADLIIKMAKNLEVSQEIGRNNLDRVRKEFSVSNMCSSYENIIKDCLIR